MLLALTILKKYRHYNNILIISYLFTFFFFAKIYVYQEFNSEMLMNFLIIIASLGYSVYLYQERISAKHISYIYYFCMLILCIYFLVGVDPSDISKVSSGNIVNYVVILMSILLIGITYKHKNKIIILPSVLSLVISFWTFGRSGIACSLILLIGLIILKIKSKLSRIKLILLFIVFSLSGFFIYNYIYELLFNIMYRFGERSTFFTGSSREKIWSEYIGNLTPLKIIFGYDSSPHYFYGFTNLHNSFLQFHYNYGLFGIILIISLIYASYISIKKQEYIYTLLITCIIIRGSTDILLFSNLYDYVLFFLLITIFFIKEKEKPLILD